MEAPIINVSEEPVGTDLDADVAAGATVLTPSDIEALDYEGGTLIIGDLEGTHEEITYDPIDTDIDGNPAQTTITFTPALANAYTSDSSAKLLVTSKGEVLVERFVYLKTALQEEDGKALIPSDLWDRIPLDPATRDPDTAEVVICDWDEDLGQMLVRSILARKPQQTAEFIVPDSFPVPPSDGTPPVLSPTPTIRGMLGALVVDWSAVTNVDAVTYEVHVSPTSGFTPDATTLAEEVKGTMSWIRSLPDGTPLAYGSTYYVKLVAKDEDGDAPPSAEASGSPEQITSPDIAANAILANHILAGEITGEKFAAVLLIATTMKTAPSGRRVEVTPDGIVLYDGDADSTPMVILPTSAGQSALFNGDLTAQSLVVKGSASFESVVTMETGAVVTLQASQSNPAQAPAVAINFETLPLANGDAAQSSGVGLAYTTQGGGAGTSTVVIASQDVEDLFGGHSVIEEYTASTGNLNRSLFATSDGEVCKGLTVCTVGGVPKLFVLGLVGGFGGVGGLFWSIKRYDLASKAFEAEANISGAIPQAGDPRCSATLGCVNNVPMVVTQAPGDPTTALPARWLSYSASTLALSSSSDSTGKSYLNDTDYGDLFVGVAYDGTSRWLSVRNDRNHGQINHRFTHASPPVYEANHDFSSSVYFQRGLIWDTTNSLFWSRGAGAPVLAKHTAWDWQAEDPHYWVAYSWYDGTNETKVSPQQTIDLSRYRRARIKITVPAFPSGVTQARTYVERNATKPATTALHRQAVPAQVSTQSSVVRYMKDFDAAGAAPPTTNGFATAGTPARIDTSPTMAGLNAAGSLRGSGEVKLTTLTAAGMDGWTPAAGEGTLGYDSDDDTPGFYDGAAWKRLVKRVGVGSFFPSPPPFAAPASQAAVANLLLYVQIIVEEKATLTGIAYVVGSTQLGNAKSALYDASGNRLAQRTTNSNVPAPASLHQVAFDGTYVALRGRYFASLIFSAAASYLGAVPKGPAGSAAQGGFTNPATIVVPTAMVMAPSLTTY